MMVNLLPGGGVSFMSAILGLGSFATPYILNVIASFGGGNTNIKFWAGVVFLFFAAVIAIPVMSGAKKVGIDDFLCNILFY